MLKSTKIVLFPILIAVITIPLSIVQFVEGESNTNDTHTLSAYEELLLEHVEEFNNPTGSVGSTDVESSIDTTEYIIELREFINSLDGYEAKMFEKINEYAEAKKQLENAKEQEESNEIIDRLEKNTMRKQFELEDLGVTTQEKIRANPEYWMEKIQNVKANIESNEVGYVNGFSNESNLHYVHQTDLALKRNSMVTVPCFPLDAGPFYCPIIDWGWNAGTSIATWWFLPSNGDVDFYSSVCLDKSTHHSNVDFDMETIREIISVFGTRTTSTNTYEPNFDSKGDCSTNELTQFVQATNRVSTITSISNISLN